MKTGYDQHFRKVKQSSKAPAFEVKLHKNSNVKSPAKKEKKRAFPVMPLFSFIILAAIGLLLLDNSESVENYMKKIEIGIGTAQAEETKKDAKAAGSATATTTTADSKSIPVEAKKMDEAEYMFKLADRKKQLDQREEELNKLAEHIEKQKAEIAEKLNKLEETRIKISKALEEKIKVDDVKVETLVQMYTNMKPVQAAKVFETLDEDLVIEILGRMKKKNAADILNLIKPEKAQIFAERFAGYRTPASK